MHQFRAVLFVFAFLFALAPFRAQGQNAVPQLPSFLSWGSTQHQGEPWVLNASRPYNFKHGLAGRHLYISPSHGRYFDGTKWKWQRPIMFCTVEDLLTQSYVFPYLIPMLEKAGAVVYTPRERDPQTREAVVDNDSPSRYGAYVETNTASQSWQTASVRGFLQPMTTLNDLSQPFLSGTARSIPTTRNRDNAASVSWTPLIPQAGHYAVYVTYPNLPDAVSDARYTVRHSGGNTTFRVNQRIGGGTWLYLGTFFFDEGKNAQGSVMLHNYSKQQGSIAADAVRFGGGMAQTERSLPIETLQADSTIVRSYARGLTSGMARQHEGARYYAQWAGLPDTLFNTGLSLNDYADDIRSRSHLLNYLAGGSAYVPDTTGRGVPFELAFALHTDAGFSRTGAHTGALGIVTTTGDRADSTYRTGTDRRSAFSYAQEVLNSVTNDISRTFSPTFPLRELRNANYGETRSPLVPSMILELLAHQNFYDMKLAHDPHFKFLASRAIYKGILRYVASMHGERNPVVQPLPPSSFSATLVKGTNQVKLAWQPTLDTLEAHAQASNYIVYQRTAHTDFDNGRLTNGRTSITLDIEPGVHYIYKVAALNAGGESFASEPLSVYASKLHRSGRGREVLMVNAFDRLSGPARIETTDSLGFDLSADLGVPYHYTTAFTGQQTNFSRAAMGKEGPSGLGFGSTEINGQLLAGNAFDGVELHSNALLATRSDLSISSTSVSAFGRMSERQLQPYALIDYIAGLNRDVPHNLLPYRAFPTAAQEQLSRFQSRGGALLVSGSFIGSDMPSESQRQWLATTLRLRHEANIAHGERRNFYGLKLHLPVFTQLNSTHYACTHSDVLSPLEGAFSAFTYGYGGYSAGVAYSSPQRRCLTLGFPFECIVGNSLRAQSMGAILRFLLP